jgi:DNA-binding winged helix-turn-helix (wHTH) protein
MADRMHFGDFELNVATGELRRDGRPVPLQRQPALALLLLASRHGELVTRQELRSAIWSDDTHVDFERGLNFCIRQIRSALDDHAKSPRFVETVARQGYRFVARPERAPAESTHDRPRGQPSLSCLVRGGLTGATLAAAGIALLAALPAQPPGPHPPTHHRAAVTFVRNLHDVVFGPNASGPHHEAAKRAAAALHDLFY